MELERILNGAELGINNSAQLISYSHMNLFNSSVKSGEILQEIEKCKQKIQVNRMCMS